MGRSLTVQGAVILPRHKKASNMVGTSIWNASITHSLEPPFLMCGPRQCDQLIDAMQYKERVIYKVSISSIIIY